MHAPISLPLLIKLSAASVSGAGFFLAWRHGRRADVLASQLSELRSALRGLSRPPVIFVVGFRGHGKSSFVNTACRVLAEEDGPLVLRTETAPMGPTRTTLIPRVVHAAGGLVTLVDTPGLPAERMTRTHAESALPRAADGGPEPECVVVVVRALYQRYAAERQLLMKRIMEVAAVVRDKGLPVVVVVTHKKAAGMKVREEQALLQELALRAKTDCVYFMENYTAASAEHRRRNSPSSNSLTMKNDFETHTATLAAVRQCVEFVATRRNEPPPPPPDLCSNLLVPI